MKKRVSIITWLGNTTLNYGSALQATAMQELLRKENCNPTTIDFMYLGKTKKEIASALLENGIQYTKTYFKFQQWYKKYMKLSPVCYYDDDIVEYAKNNSDILLCGSDCIWGDKYNASQRFFWDYRELDKIPHIAYASGLNEGSISYNMQNVISSFVAISGREQHLAQAMKEYKKEVDTVLDPTLTVNEKFWDDKASRRLIKEDYIVCYILSKIENHLLSIEKIKNKYGVKRVVCINTDIVDKPCNDIYSDYRNGKFDKAIGPAEFLSLIKYATAVCTDSFHGTCFSIINEKDFYIFDLHRISRQKGDNRFNSLLPKLGVQNRFVQTNKDIDSVAEIDWEDVRLRLKNERLHSVQFLREALAKAEQFGE